MSTVRQLACSDRLPKKRDETAAAGWYRQPEINVHLFCHSCLTFASAFFGMRLKYYHCGQLPSPSQVLDRFAVILAAPIQPTTPKKERHPLLPFLSLGVFPVFSWRKLSKINEKPNPVALAQKLHKAARECCKCLNGELGNAFSNR